MIYILEFAIPLGNARHSARYYLGYCADGRLDQRLAEHRQGTGAAMTRAANERGIAFDVVATLPGGREVERRLKRQKHTPRIVERLRREALRKSVESTPVAELTISTLALMVAPNR